MLKFGFMVAKAKKVGGHKGAVGAEILDESVIGSLGFAAQKRASEFILRAVV